MTSNHSFDLMKFPVWNWIVLGGSGSGKSSAACRLLTSYFQAGYSLLYLNFKIDGGEKEAGPQRLDELLSLMMALDTTPVDCVHVTELATLLNGSKQVVAYSETDGDNYGSNRANCEKLFQALSKRGKIIVCLDEILNFLPSTDSIFTEIYLKDGNQARTINRYYVWIHQQLGGVNRITGWDNNYAYLFAGPQSQQDGEAFRILDGNCEGPVDLGHLHLTDAAVFPIYSNKGQAVAIAYAKGPIWPMRIELPRMQDSGVFEQTKEKLKKIVWNDKVSLRDL